MGVLRSVAGPLLHSMPSRPPNPCTEPGCSALLHPSRSNRSGRCERHRRAADRRVKAGQPHRAYGTPRWRRIRAQVLREEPVCRDCDAPSVEVDHISPRRLELEAGRDPDRRENLQGLCRRHHSAKTAREIGFGGDHT